MAEFDMIIPTSPQENLMKREGNIFPVFVHPVADTRAARTGNVLPLFIHNVNDIPVKRVPYNLTNAEAMPLRFLVKTENGIEEPAKKETRDWPMVLSFGGGNDAPRRYPLDTAWTKKQF